MFLRKKITAYLNSRQDTITAFEELLQEYLDGELKRKLDVMGLKRTEIHIDWLDAYKCIDIQGFFGDYTVDLQIEPKIFRIAKDTDEPDEFITHELAGKELFYEVVKDFLLPVTLQGEQKL